ncbi:Arm DNA-binding domain-containing protein [Novosphingobium fluoreni]
MHGLYLLVLPSGGRYWRLDYRHEGKRGTMALFQRGGDRAWLPRNG